MTQWRVDLIVLWDGHVSPAHIVTVKTNCGLLTSITRVLLEAYISILSHRIYRGYTVGYRIMPFDIGHYGLSNTVVVTFDIFTVVLARYSNVVIMNASEFLRCVVHNARVKSPVTMRRSAFVFACIALVATAAFSGEGMIRRSAKNIPGRYIVVLEASADAATVANTCASQGCTGAAYVRARTQGLAVEISDVDAQALARDARVQFVEEDSNVSAAAANWGLDRVDQRSLPLNGTYVSDGTEPA